MALSKVGGNQIDTVSGDLTVDTNTLVVDSTNNKVGIGTTSPTYQTTVYGSSQSTVEIESGSDTGESRLYFTDPTTTGVGEIGYYHNGNTMRFNVNNAERMRIDSGGNVGIGAASSNQTLHVQGNGARLVNSSDTDALHLFEFNGSNHASYSMYTASGNNNVKISTSETSFFNGGSLLVGTTSASMSGFDDARFRSHANGKTGIIVSEVFTDGEGIIIQGSSNTGNRNAIVFLNGGLGTVGSVVFSSSSTSYNTSSDHRLKQGVEDMTGAIDRVKALAPKRFQFITDANTTVDGFLAHEAQAVVPEAVTGTHNEVDDDGNAVMQGIDQSKLVPLLTGALQEAIAKIETLETKVAALEAG